MFTHFNDVKRGKLYLKLWIHFALTVYYLVCCTFEGELAYEEAYHADFRHYQVKGELIVCSCLVFNHTCLCL